MLKMTSVLLIIIRPYYSDISGCKQSVVGSRGMFPPILYGNGQRNFTCTFDVTNQNAGNVFVLSFNQFNVPNGHVDILLDGKNHTLSGKVDLRFPFKRK